MHTPDTMTHIPAPLLGLIIGLIPFVFLLVRRSGSTASLGALNERLSSRDQQIAALGQQLATAVSRSEELDRQLKTESSARTAAETQSARIPALEQETMTLREENSRLLSANTGIQTSLVKERESADEKLRLLTGAREELSNQFKTLADEILETKSKRFAEQNQESLGAILEPLKTQIGDFKNKVEEVYVKEGEARAGLRTQVEMLANLNQKISEDAKNLTTALQGSNKIQGNYGELVLVDLLKKSGLIEGDHFHVQASERREDGTLAQPDVVIHLPEDRRLVVDSKISLKSYVAAVNAAGDDERKEALKAHITSLKTHISGLSGKNYHSLYGLQSLDFVVMFVPIEPAFMMAIGHQQDLFNDAWNKNVLLVSPSTLLFVVRTVANLWRQEAQSRNAKEIADQGASLYEKLVGFVEDLNDLGNRLKQAQKSYTDAYKKLSTGKDNAIRQTLKLVKLGVQPKRMLPEQLVERSLEDLPAIELPREEENEGGE